MPFRAVLLALALPAALAVRAGEVEVAAAANLAPAMRQLAAGATTEQIAANLNLSIKTVQNYHYLIKTKTGMRTDAQLVRLAVECGLASL